MREEERERHEEDEVDEACGRHAGRRRRPMVAGEGRGGNHGAVVGRGGRGRGGGEGWNYGRGGTRRRFEKFPLATRRPVGVVGGFGLDLAGPRWRWVGRLFLSHFAVPQNSICRILVVSTS